MDGQPIKNWRPSRQWGFKKAYRDSKVVGGSKSLIFFFFSQIVDLFRTGRESTSLTAPGRLERSSSITSIASNCSGDNNDVTQISNKDENDFLIKKLQNSDSSSIVESYFRPRRATELITQSRGFTSWKDTTKNWTNGGNLLLNRTWCAGVSNQDNLTQGRGSQ